MVSDWMNIQVYASYRDPLYPEAVQLYFARIGMEHVHSVWRMLMKHRHGVVC